MIRNRLAAVATACLVVGIGVGVLIGSVRWLRALTEPVLEFLRAIPPPVLVPVLILVAGIGAMTGGSDAMPGMSHDSMPGMKMNH